MDNTPKKENSGQANAEKGDHHLGLKVSPTMPYYCTWLPGACPAASPQALAQVPVYPPCGGQANYAMVVNAWAQRMQAYCHFVNNQPTVVAKEETVTIPQPIEPKNIVRDDLKIVEGIGPKIEQLLNQADICTWEELSKARITVLRGILADAGNRYAIHDPKTWAKQAKMAANGKMEALKAWQKELKGGK